MNNIKKLLADIQKKVPLEKVELIYQGYYYQHDQIRGAVYDCQYQGKPAILKIVDDERIMLELDAHKDFLAKNTSKKLKAPQIYQSEQLSPTCTWILMEKVPAGQVFDLPYIEKNRAEFLEMYLEYRNSFPAQPSRALTLAENLPANDFHTMRLARWADLGNTQEYRDFLKDGKRIVDPAKLAVLFSRSLKIINEIFTGRPMIWSKGNFWPNHLIRTAPGEYYLLDFSLTKMYPQGYELGALLWSCYLMSLHYNDPLDQWLSGMDSWGKDLTDLAEKLKYPDPENLLRGCLLERAWGSIFADTLATDKPAQYKAKMLEYLTQLVEKLLK